MVAATSAMYSAQSVVTAAAVTAAVSVGAVLFSLYLLFDLQMIRSGAALGSGGGGTGGGGTLLVTARRRDVELSPDEYVYGALILYLDIVYVFVNVLQLVQAASDSS